MNILTKFVTWLVIREQGTGNREQETGKRFWTTLLFVTYVGFFPSPTYN
ncbi:MAG: hypothetical protein ACK4ZH_16180 [Dolichospermum sp.]